MSAAPAGAFRVHLVRHAHAGDRDEWHGPDRFRPLTEEGWEQARRIAERLAPERPGLLLTSPYKRCRQTLEPLAEALGLPLRHEERLIEGRSPEAALSLLLEADVDVVACTHGDIVAAVVEGLYRAGLTREPAWAKGSTWILDVVQQKVVAARYLV